ncbi:MAG: hypothetical protein QME07_00470 [bacterium]|nr:hypothetical protein [bacterium]
MKSEKQKEEEEGAQRHKDTSEKLKVKSEKQGEEEEGAQRSTEEGRREVRVLGREIRNSE